MNPINVDRFGKAIVTTIGIVFICVVKNAKKPLQKVGTKINVPLSIKNHPIYFIL